MAKPASCFTLVNSFFLSGSQDHLAAAAAGEPIGG